MVNHIRTKDSMVATTANVVFPQMQPDMSQPEIFKAPSNFTQLERARIIVQSGKISFDPKLHIFNVLGSGDRPCVVRLFPKVLCSCPSTGLCYHIVAVKISIGSEMKVSQIQKLNLTLFRKRCKSRKDKTSGRKRPREKDIDSNPSEAFENKINIKSNHDDTLEIECPQKFSLPTISSSEERMPTSGFFHCSNDSVESNNELPLQILLPSTDSCNSAVNSSEEIISNRLLATTFPDSMNVEGDDSNKTFSSCIFSAEKNPAKPLQMY